jgi:NUMOD4 motif/HNH endonuclease
MSLQDDAEAWLPVPGYEGFYEVSDLGRVRSLPRWKVRGGILKPFTTGQAKYAAVTLYSGSKASARTWAVHVLVAMAFCEGHAPGLEVRHENGDKHNNAASNLSWGTHQVNQQDMIRHGTHLNARKTYCDNGHEFTPANTYIRPSGHRACRKCTADSQRRYRERQGYRVRR